MSFLGVVFLRFLARQTTGVFGGRSGQSPDGAGARGETRRDKYTVTTKRGLVAQAETHKGWELFGALVEAETEQGAREEGREPKDREERRADANDRGPKRSFLWGGAL